MSHQHINDDNTLEDIFGCIFVAQAWPSHPDDPPIADQLDKIIARIEDKLARNTNQTRHNWFSAALDFSQQARASYLANDFERGYDLLRRCHEYLESGNKAHRRKTAFIVGPDGVAHRASGNTASSPDERTSNQTG